MTSASDYSDPVYSVSSLTFYIRQVFDNDEFLQDLWVEGEVSNFSRPSSGHWYFTVKDNKAQLKAVMWKTSAARQRYVPEHGEKIRARGRISVYEASGQYQLYCEEIIPLATIGDLHAQFRELWDQLEAQGLFSPEIKRPLPDFPQRIGVVTSATTAAFQDIQNVLQRRYPLAHLILSPTPVQGVEAASRIVIALRQIDAYGVDVILLARGGGSLEDLWCFNDERIARAIRETHTPVVTGVGHETDTTLVDGSADQRAPTPSAGAELITPDVQDIHERLGDLMLRLREASQEALETRRQQVEDASHKLRLVSPLARIRNERQRLDELDARLTKATQNQFAICQQRLQAQTRALELANPQSLLARGYAIVTRAGDGKRLTNAIDAAPGTMLKVRLEKGQLTASVKERNLDG